MRTTTRFRVLFGEAWPILAAALALTACNGDKGPLVLVDTVEPGDDCAEGGLEIVSGVDADGDGALTGDEVQASEFLCNGASGGDGADAAISTTTLLEEGSEDCRWGGFRVDQGLDDGSGGGTADDGVLQDGEITATDFVCNGQPGVHGTSNEPPAGPAGAYTIDLSGGAGTASDGGNGGDLDLEFNYGTYGGGIKVFPTGQASHHLVFPTTVATYLGPVPAIVSSDYTVPVDPDTGDLAEGALYQVSYDVDSTDFDALLRWNDTDGVGEVVTGLRIEAGATLTLQDVYGTNGDAAQVELEYDFHLAGTVTTDDGSGGHLSLDLYVGNFVGEATGRVDQAGDSGEPGGDFDVVAELEVGDLQESAGAVFNRATIDTRGGDGTSGGAGGDVDLEGYIAVYNAGSIDTSGGSGSSGDGGHAGRIDLDVDYGNLLNTGALTMNGGDHTGTDGSGAYGGEAYLYNGYVGWVVNEGTITARGGSTGTCTGSCTGGDGGSLYAYLYSNGFVNTGDLVAPGGDAPGPADPDDETSQGGDGGIFYVYASEYEDGWGGGDYLPIRDIAVSGAMDLSGGAGLQGGNAGWFEIYSNPDYVPDDQQILLYGYTSLDLSGGDGATSGGSGGSVDIYTDYAEGELFDYGPGGSMVNHVPMDLSGGDGAEDCGGNGGDVEMYTDYDYGYDAPWDVVINTGDLDLTGGDGADCDGGSGGYLYLYGYSGVTNEGAVDASGGDASGAGLYGGYAGEIDLLSDNGPVVNTGDLTGEGGDAPAGNGYYGATIEIVGASVTNSGALRASGGDGATTESYVGGEGGNVFLHSLYDHTEQTATTLEVDGGAGATAGDHGLVIIDGINFTDDWTN